MITDRLPRRVGVSRFKCADDVLMLAHKSLHFARPPAVGRARDLLMIAEPAIGLGARWIICERDQFDMKALVQGNEVPERLEGRAVGAGGDQLVNGLEMVERLAVAACDGELSGTHLDDEPRFEQLAELVVSSGETRRDSSCCARR